MSKQNAKRSSQFVEPAQQLNLIIGKNGTCKTTLLQARVWETMFLSMAGQMVTESR